MFLDTEFPTTLLNFKSVALNSLSINSEQKNIKTKTKYLSFNI